MENMMQLSPLLHFVAAPLQADLASAGDANAWSHWLGNYHFIFVHFPIALIIMACVAELIFTWKKDPRYSFVVNFLLISAAILVIPTVISGLSLKESGMGTGDSSLLLEWHEIFGIITLSLTFITLVLRNFQTSRKLYLVSLIFLLISLCVTAQLGGLMAFGDFNLLPPLSN
jgi:uncharacterized membrane protein